MAKCSLCDKEAVTNGYCYNHYQSQYRKAKKASGTCVQCSSPAAPGKTRCEYHHNKHHEANKTWWKKEENKDKRLVINKKHADNKHRAKEEGIAKLGGKCVCCGESNPKFLTVDHIDGNGKAHRKTMKRDSIYVWLKENNYPPGFQLLCWNCNCGRAHNKGVCPHKEVQI